MRCPFCKSDDSRVVDSRVIDDGLAGPFGVVGIRV